MASPAPSTKQQPAARAPGSLLSSVKRGVQKRPLRVVAYGPEGIGKTSFAAAAPHPIFLGSEDGFGTIDAARFPAPALWSDVRAALHELATEPHDFETVVIDTADWIEPLLQRDVCERHGKASLEAFGFNKGYVAALDEGWRPMLGQLETLGRKEMHVVILAHAKAENHQPPDGDAYERWTLKIDKRASGLLKEWCDTLLFMQWSGGLVEKSDRKKGRALGERYRALFTQSASGAFEAKNRFGLPPSMPLSWPEFFDGYQRAFDVPRLRAEFDAVAASAPPEIAARARAWLDEDPADLSRIPRAIERLSTTANRSNTNTTEE